MSVLFTTVDVDCNKGSSKAKKRNNSSLVLKMGLSKNMWFVVKTLIFLNTGEKISGFTHDLCGTC